MSKINIFIFFLVAPFLSLFLVCMDFVEISNALHIPLKEAQKDIRGLHKETENFHEDIVSLENQIYKFHEGAINQRETFNKQGDKITELSNLSDKQKKLSEDIYEQKILEMLGPAIKAHISDRVEIKIFQLKELGYRGYIAKVKLFDPSAFKVNLAKDKLGEAETVSSMAKRKGAILAINGGGFFSTKKNGKKFIKMTANTVVDGRLLEPFYQDGENFFFAGINKKGQVIGTVPRKLEDILKLDPYQGVSFVPMLLKDGKKVQIPKQWKETRHPRTILGKYSNDDLIMIVIDGRQGEWSIGVSLERLQDKLLELGVKDAYNLDGGGSSTFYYNGEVLNRPSDGRERPVVSSILIYP
ncbi:phosphodiester glycosidase family protein [Paramaledivibacter caminithermalis]|jgi:exopolysaccharide biosynthesis protein|uniref:Exopolysaccharide biosynthesis protein n=1 Tax=Paramaledivibacter caminithermalis (strain DSM 15212 / CIP 107654 / DViRD3) TaxID=1121301 RepID=A0A1M6Q2K1_PARC5|nr:phosphodiester glycosidase family protein [Paramaledivibacter caminithermalis]SHK14430.1 Exopolysaccharide biosynthesis protein [Paramaledivibacter caminithermalis DSM 15212]